MSGTLQPSDWPADCSAGRITDSSAEVLGRYAVSSRDLGVQRAARADAADERLRVLLGDSPEGVALVAVGGYGRRELSPYSDLDVVLLHADDADPAPVAERVWYPLWDDGVALDHSVRTVEQMREAAAADLRTALGLLDARHVAGDPSLTLWARTLLLADWRAAARRRLPELAAGCAERAERAGEVAHTAVPHLKESRGGIRDAVVLRALVASWLVDVPHAEVERCRGELLAVRDALHLVSGRATDRLLPELLPEVAQLLGVDVDRHVREVGRRTAYLAQLTWRRVEHVLARPSRGRRPDLRSVADGVAESAGEVVLEAGARADRDPLLALRAAVAAAERNRVLAPASAVRLARTSARLPEPWPAEARRLLVRLLGSGPALPAVWEELEQSGLLLHWLPEWDAVTLLRSDSPVHRFTVDRHLVATCVQAAKLLQRVRRPDLLLLAALLHDIGKGPADHSRGGNHSAAADHSDLGDHSEVGARRARAVLERWGFPPDDVDTVTRLVELHLLLPHTATRRDLDDPATADLVATAVGSTDTLDLLAALTEADARATGPAAWSGWRARLVGQLLRRTRAVLEGQPGRGATAGLDVAAAAPAPGPGEVHVRVERHLDGTVVEVGAADRVGVLADVARGLAAERLEILSARAETVDSTAWSRWLVSDTVVDERRLRQRLVGVLAGSAPARVPMPDRETEPAERPVVTVQASASDSATVLEVRDRDWRGLVSVVCGAVAAAGVDVRSAHVETLGPRAVDVFYLREPGGGALSAARADEVRRLVARAVGSD